MENSNRKYIYSIFTLFMAAILWYLTFVVKPINFWLEMSLSILLLVCSALFIKRDLFSFSKVTLRYVIVGVVSAIVLYIIFYIGNIVSGFLFPFKDAQISSIYGNKAEGNIFLIGLLLLFVIGPGEEIYWRKFIQTFFSEKFGENKGYIISAILYSAVHIVTGNFMITLAALVCGLYWGWIYKKEKNIIPVIISHALWDVTIFLLLPIGT